LTLQDEIREIVKRRTAFERALIRRVARKEDFLRYAAYELNLDALRKMRLKRRSASHSLSLHLDVSVAA
jgi:U3 small nucleolar RNA-associated protein 6